MLISILFWIFLIGVIGKGIAFSFKLTWTLAKIFLVMFLLPVVLAGFFLWGFGSLFFPVLLILGLVWLLSGKRAAA